MVGCEKCIKYYNPVVSENCKFCSNYTFHENILCDLTRFAQNNDTGIECFAFKPDLSAVGETKEIYEAVSSSDTSEKLLDRRNWLKAYAIQHLNSDPDQIIYNLNYHICLVTVNRENLLQNIGNNLLEVPAIFQNSGNQFDSKVNLLCAGYDHIHLHINSSPDYSADDVVNNFIANLNSSIKREFSGLFRDREKIFEKSYFAETIG